MDKGQATAIAGILWGEAHSIVASALIETPGSVREAVQQTALPYQDFVFAVATMTNMGLFECKNKDETIDIDNMIVAPVEFEAFIDQLDGDLKQPFRDLVQRTCGRNFCGTKTSSDNHFGRRRIKKRKKLP